MRTPLIFRSIVALLAGVLTSGSPAAYASHGSSDITSLAIHPETPNILYAGTADRGVVKSTDGGTTWSVTGLLNVHVTDLVIDPQHPTTLYAGTEGAGVLKTTDEGATWTATSLDGTVSVMAIDPATPTLYALRSDGLSKSTDGGATWIASLMNDEIAPYKTIIDVIIDPRVPTMPYAYVSISTPVMEWGQLWMSPDAGTTWGGFWQSDGGFLVELDMRVLMIDGTGTLYAVGTDWSYRGLFNSIDGGGTWNFLNGMFDIRSLVADPSNPILLYAGTPAGVQKSTDGGATWTLTNVGLTDLAAPQPDVRALVINPVEPSTLFAGTEVGVFKTTDGAATWNATGLIRHSPLASINVNPTAVLGGLETAGTVNLLTPAPDGGTIIALSTSAIAVATVPTSVTIPAGSTTASFPVSTYSVPETTGVWISATLDDALKSAGLYVYAAGTLVFISVPTSVEGGATVTGSVHLGGGVAPVGGALVQLSSSNPTAATVPASVMVPAGGGYVSFPIVTQLVTVSTSLIISGTYAGVTKSGTLTVTPSPVVLSSLSLSPGTVTGGTVSTATVTLSAAARAGGAVIALSSSNGTVADLPGNVTVPAGHTSASVPVSTTATCAAATASISGTLGEVTKSAVLTVNPRTSDTVAIQRAEYVRRRQGELRVTASSSIATATLQVFVTSSGELIGALTGNGGGAYDGQFHVLVDPRSITVVSSSCGSATSPVTSK